MAEEISLSATSKATEDFYFCQLHNIPCIIKFKDSSFWWKNIFGALCESMYMPQQGGLETELSVEIYPHHLREKMKAFEFIERIIESKDTLYGKDWHVDMEPTLSLLYNLPEILVDDWLDWYWKQLHQHDDDYSFVYIGNHGSFTRVHHDVCCSYSWSLNMLGKKEWTLWPPRQSRDLYDACGVEVPDARTGHFDAKNFPSLESSRKLTIIQNENECIFIPSGWHHMVVNICAELPEKCGLETRNSCPLTISLNRNWFNAYSLHEVWNFVLRELNAVRRELSHLREFTNRGPVTKSAVSGVGSNALFSSSGRSESTPLMAVADWHQQCERILKANASMNVLQLLEMIAGRVLLMETFFIIMSDGCQGWDADTARLLHRASTVVQRVDSDGTVADLPPVAATFCPHFQRKLITSADLRLFVAQLRISIPHAQTPEFLLSSYTKDNCGSKSSFDSETFPISISPVCLCDAMMCPSNTSKIGTLRRESSESIDEVMSFDFLRNGAIVVPDSLATDAEYSSDNTISSSSKQMRRSHFVNVDTRTGLLATECESDSDGNGDSGISEVVPLLTLAEVRVDAQPCDHSPTVSIFPMSAWHYSLAQMLVVLLEMRNSVDMLGHIADCLLADGRSDVQPESDTAGLEIAQRSLDSLVALSRRLLEVNDHARTCT